MELTQSSPKKITVKPAREFARKNIVFHCLKGGVAKTTLAYNTAFRMSQLGARVLLVDLDKQANATISFGIERPAQTFVDVVTESAKVSDIIVPISDRLHVVPSSLDNAKLEMELVHRRTNPTTYYQSLFAPVRDRYDLLIFDLPPDLSHNTFLCSLYADVICIPTTPDEYSVYGMKMTLSAIEGIHKEFPNRHHDVFVVWTKFDAREKSSLKYISELKDFGSATVMPIVIRTDSTFKQAQARAKSVFQYRKECNAKEDIGLLCDSLLNLDSFDDEENP